MPNQFYKGRTNNHLSWVSVDSTDGLTPESAMSGAQKLAIYGKVRGATGVNFVSSGTGSMAGGDIVHVGPSATGVYTVALVKADLSDASAAWYDQYICIITGTGMAQQVLVVDGGIDASTILAMSGMLSDAHSAAILAASNASEAQSLAALAASRVLLVQSRLSELDSRIASEMSDAYSLLSSLNSEFLSRVPKAVATASFLSDAHSDLKSAIGAVSVTLTASDISQIASEVAVAIAVSGPISDIYSLLSDLNSNILSRVTATVATRSQLSDLHSDLRSYLVVLSDQVSDMKSDLRSMISATGPTVSDIASAIIVEFGGDMSDIRSAITAGGGGGDVSSELSDLYSLLSSLNSEFLSRVPKAVATNSQLSDLHSDLKSHLAVSSGIQSDIYSLLSDLHSDVVVLSGVVSDLQSDFQSRVPKAVATSSQLSDLHSDLKSQITVGVNVKAVNGTTLTGDGNATPWGPA